MVRALGEHRDRYQHIAIVERQPLAAACAHQFTCFGLREFEFLRLAPASVCSPAKVANPAVFSRPDQLLVFVMHVLSQTKHRACLRVKFRYDVADNVFKSTAQNLALECRDRFAVAPGLAAIKALAEMGL